MGLNSFISKEEQKQIVKAIENAENMTSGEIRVHIESVCKNPNVYDRAIEVFHKLKMQETAQRNAALIYIAFKSHKFAIIGDSGINEIVPPDFWNNEKDTLAKYLSENKAAIGICKTIEKIGENLKQYFPYQDDDINEQSNEISYGE